MVDEEKENEKIQDENGILNKNYEIEYIIEKCSTDLLFYKVIIVGDYESGKGKIASLLFNKEYNDNYSPTISVDISNYQIKINNEIIQISFWIPINNQEFLNAVNFFRNASLAIIVYSTDNRSSFDSAEYIHNKINCYCFNCIKFLVGNNIRSEEYREVPKLDKEYMKNFGFDLLMEVSSETGYNIENLKKNIIYYLYLKEKEDYLLLEEALNKIGKNKKKKNNIFNLSYNLK